MFRRPLFALALLSALTGCVAAPPGGPLVEYRAGLTPITRPVKCPGTYALHARDRSPEPLLTYDAGVGERIGFRREEDGSVTALAPGQTLPLPPGAYTWDVLPETVPPWRERFRAKVPERPDYTFKDAGNALFAVALITGLIGLKVLYAYAQGNTPR